MRKRRLYTPSMFLKLFLALSITSLLVFSGLLYGALKSSREALIRQKSDDMKIFIERTGQYLDLYLYNIRNSLIHASNLMDSEVLDNRNELRKLLSEQTRQNNGIISHMYMMLDDGIIVSSDQVAYDIVGHPSLREIFNVAYQNPGIVNWSEPYYSPLQVNNTIAFAMTLQHTGPIILAEINTPVLTKQLNEMLYNSGQSFTLFTERGNIVSYDPYSKIVPYKPTTLPPEMRDDFIESLVNIQNGVNQIDGVNGSLMVVKSERNGLGWYLVALTDERVFHKGAHQLVLNFLVMGGLWFSLLLILTVVISRHFTIPVTRLALQMNRIRDERFLSPLPRIARYDEVGKLSNSFYMMLGRIQELLQTVRDNEKRKKEMELELLLSQIRPHFLYNTLTCIASLAKQHRVAEVEETIRSLIQLLSYSIGKSGFAPLEEEIGSLRDYIQIQQMRYGHSFQFKEEIEPTLSQLFVPKLILQPLVENCIFHGLANKDNGQIVVRAAQTNGKVVLSVWDDGIGFSEERTARTSKRKQSGGIGLTNVRERIRHIYGNEHDLHIRSDPGHWTEVTLMLPVPRA